MTRETEGKEGLPATEAPGQLAFKRDETGKSCHGLDGRPGGSDKGVNILRGVPC